MPSIEAKRIALFLVGCMGARLGFAYLAYRRPDLLPYLGTLALAPAIGFTYIYMTGSRKTGAEVFGERIWWNDLRPLHAFMYFLFAGLALRSNKDAWKVLLVDALIGLAAFTHHHLTQ